MLKKIVVIKALILPCLGFATIFITVVHTILYTITVFVHWKTHSVTVTSTLIKIKNSLKC